jgi:hypothetical protein
MVIAAIAVAAGLAARLILEPTAGRALEGANAEPSLVV